MNIKIRLMYSNYIELLKPRITFLVIVTTYLGYYLGLRFNGLMMVEYISFITFLNLVLGVFLTSSGSAILNQYIERDLDLKMDRTKSRPLPSKKIPPSHALCLGIFFCFFGIIYLYFFVNILTSIISILTIVSYLFIYTPSKLKTSWNTIIGSFPGAFPPVGGWAAATGEIRSAEPIILFLILFCWQIPHFFSLAILYKDDYAKAGYKMLPSISENLDSTMFQIIFFTVALIVSTICIYLLKLTSVVYMIGAILLGLVFLFYSSSILFEQSNKKIKKLFLFSIIYLPLLILLILFDTFLL